MRRAFHPWDRFYMNQVAPWRGERNVEPLAPFLGGRVLELGCGNGKLLRPLQQAGHDVVGLDVSWHAMRRIGGVLADAAQLPFADGSFGAVMDIHCTGHLSPGEREQTTAEIWRVLAPGGHLVRRRLGPGDLRAGKGEEVPGNPGARQLQDGRVTHFTDPEGLRQELELAGFQVVAEETTRHHPRFRGEAVTRENVQAVGRKPQE